MPQHSTVLREACVKGFWGEAAGLRYVQLEPEQLATDLPLIVAIHGRGADATDLAGLAPDLDGDGYRWVLPQGPRPVPIGPGVLGWAWYELGGDQVSTATASRDLIAGFLDETLARLSVGRDRTLIMGFSQGAVMALFVGLTSPEPYAAMVAMSGYLAASDELVEVLPERKERKLLIVHGTEDETLPIERGRQARVTLEGAGLKPEYHEFPMGHQITPESFAVVKEYIHRILPPRG
jgi:phospholipase/carboxylesterase